MRRQQLKLSIKLDLDDMSLLLEYIAVDLLLLGTIHQPSNFDNIVDAIPLETVKKVLIICCITLSHVLT